MTHLSSRLLAAELGVSHSTVARVWAEHDLKPWQTETFKFSTDPELEAKVRDVVGLYLDPRPMRSCCAWTRSPRSRRWSTRRSKDADQILAKLNRQTTRR